MKGGKGFVTKAGGGFAQPPGPRNALGKVKIDMPNPHSIYLHDTPSKALFAESSRAYSHGCIRVKDIDRLAAELATLDKGDVPAVTRALAGGATRTVPLGSSRPVYLVYFTVEVRPDGKVVALDDPYNRDGRLVAGLEGVTRMADADRTKRGRG
jgi:murein L,D-transpeptidase YcbB/YkuD